MFLTLLRNDGTLQTFSGGSYPPTKAAVKPALDKLNERRKKKELADFALLLLMSDF